MAKVLLIVPRLPQTLPSPYLGQLYVAAALLRAGHEVKCLNLAAPGLEDGDIYALTVAETWSPDIIGMTLFTYNALAGYQLAHTLRNHTRLLVAGGSHPTACPQEPLQHGFDISVPGEGERKLVAIATALDEHTSLEKVAGIIMAQSEGPSVGSIEDLDALPFPHEAMASYDLAVHGPPGDAQLLPPTGLMTSRGCPARCSFCANYVTGRVFRWRSSGNVVAEMLALSQLYGVRNFPFWDDAFTAHRQRLDTLCQSIMEQDALQDSTWTCITPANMVAARDLERMRKAGCVAINFGIESGDPTVLKRIRKGQKTSQVIEAVSAAKSLGMTTIVNFMFGFPDEGLDELKRTQDVMCHLSEKTDYFNNVGVLVPFPGTSVYAEHHQTYGFSEWWLEEDRIPGVHGSFGDPANDPSLDLNFFNYSDALRREIERSVRFKAQHNLKHIDRLRSLGPASSSTQQFMSQY